MLDRCRGSAAEIIAMEAAAIAASKGMSSNCSCAHDQAVFANSCVLYSDIRAIAAAEIDVLKGPSNKGKVAKAQAMFEIS